MPTRNVVLTDHHEEVIDRLVNPDVTRTPGIEGMSRVSSGGGCAKE